MPRTVTNGKAKEVVRIPMEHIPEVTIPGILHRLWVQRDDFRAALVLHVAHGDCEEKREAIENDIAALNKTIALMGPLAEQHYKG